MSFELFFATCRYDGTIRSYTNPFTRKVEEGPDSAPLTESEQRAVWNVINAVAKKSEDDEYTATFSDGASVWIRASQTLEYCDVVIRGAGVTASVATFLFDMMRAGNWLIFEDQVVLATSHESVKNPPADSGFDSVVLVNSPTEVAQHLQPSYEAWQRYRDGVTKQPTTSSELSAQNLSVETPKPFIADLAERQQRTRQRIKQQLFRRVYLGIALLMLLGLFRLFLDAHTGIVVLPSLLLIGIVLTMGMMNWYFRRS